MPPKITSTGRPASPFPKRYAIRHDESMWLSWSKAAATCGMTIQDWIRATLAGEVNKATHVPMVKREGRRG